MKIMLKSVFSIMLLVITMLACGQQREERDLPSFTAVALGISGDLYLTQGSPQKVVIQSQSDLDRIETEVKNGVLRIKTDTWSQRIKGAKIWITMPAVEALHVSGSGNMEAETSIDADELELKVSGSGTIKITKLSADEIEAAVSGSGDIILAGDADEVDISISGSGGVQAEALEADEGGIKISGSGNCSIDVTEELEVLISGSGTVTYYSKPQVDARISGSGKVRKGN
jgi:hypothetical protein